jgi:glutamate-ammonia-ligase adenylyltransferase
MPVQGRTMSGEWQDAIERAQAHAPFLAGALARLPELAALLAAGDGEAALKWAKRAGEDAPDVPAALRRERLAMALALGIGDLAGAFPLDRVMAELSDLADRALDAAIADAIRHRVPDAAPAGFTALALGKHGAGELNYSSDIDPILLYDPALLPRRERDEPAEAAVRVARRVVETLTAQTAEGYVFRVDLRLRPASEVTPLAISFDAALTHYESSALAWERAAFIRARASAGDVAAGERFLAAIRPFVWRRSLDFGAIEDIRRLTERIRADHVGPREPGPGFDVKRGRGGIREIEFFAQTHQLIHGGRNPALRQRGTRPALDALAAAGLIAASDATLLGESYDRLRTIEHRLQMVADRQTHRLPPDPAAIDSVAKLDGLPDGAALIEELRGITAHVGRLYDGLLGECSPSGSAPAPAGSALAARIDALGLPEPDKMAARIEGWSDGRMRALRSPAAQAAFEDLLPSLLAALANAADPERALARWESLVAGLPSAVNLFRLLEARPGLAELVLRILTLAPTLADELARRTGLLDPLIDSTALDLPGPVDALAARMCNDGDYEARLDQIREVVGELRFALGVQLVEAAHDPLEIAAALCRVAEAALICAAEAASAEFAAAHGRIAGSDLLVLGLGRLGGGALTHASDLDLIYLFSGGTEAGESDGRRPLSPTHYFNRLAQRVTAALSVPTAAGALYEVDTRLRPQGNQGPLAVTIDSFARYQGESAWTWEHMALTRAWVLAGPPAAKAELERVIADVLNRPRDPAKLRVDVLAMRAEMAEHKAPRGPLDAKLARGALVDLEFLVHYLQLRERTAFDPHLGAAIDTLAREGFVPDGLVAAHDLLTRLLVAARLLAPDMALPPEPAASLLAHTCGHETADSLLQAFTQARHTVAHAWADAFGEQLEIDNE